MVLRLSLIDQISSFFFNCRARLWDVPFEAVQRLTEIPEHVSEIGGQRGPPADQYIVTVRLQRYVRQPFYQFTKPATNPITLRRGSILLGHGKADPGRAIVIAPAALHDKGRAAGPRAIGNGEEVRPLP
jgi:hypothetical protein